LGGLDRTYLSSLERGRRNVGLRNVELYDDESIDVLRYFNHLKSQIMLSFPLGQYRKSTEFECLNAALEITSLSAK
jgi:hypothetical protein